jgi:WD40 repeat protein
MNRGKKERRKSGRQLWKEAIAYVFQKVLHSASKPLLPIEDLPMTEKFFHDNSSLFVDLTLDEFCQVFRIFLRERLGERACPSIHRLTEWFREIDADCSNGVSWEEFSSFNISVATSTESENVRARELVEDPIFKNRSAINEHHGPIAHIDSNPNSPYVVTGADDGLIKVWDARDSSFVHSINNSQYTSSHPQVRAGATVPIYPIVDVRFDSRGAGCFVAATDKSLHVYDGCTFELLRKYIGVQQSTLSEVTSSKNSLGCKAISEIHDKFKLAHDVDPTILLNFRDCPTAMDVAAPGSGKELLLFGTDRGAILLYPSMRSVHIPDISPLCVYQPHNDTIPKIRYLSRIDSIATCSWDLGLQLLDVETGVAKMKFEGIAKRIPASRAGHPSSGDSSDDDGPSLGHTKIVLDFAYDNVQSLIASASMERHVLLWSATYNRPLCSLNGHCAPLKGVAFADDDRLLFSVDQSGLVLTWDLRTNRVLQTVTGGKDEDDCEKSALPATSNQLMSVLHYDSSRSKLYCGNVAVKAWTMRRELGGFPASHIGHVDSITGFSIVTETSSIISTDRYNTMRWNALRGRRRCMWSNGAVELAAAGVDGTGRRLVCVGEDGSVSYQNAASGLVLRTTSSFASHFTGPPFCVLTKKAYVAIVTPNEVVVFHEESVSSLRPAPIQVIQPPRDSFFTSAVMPLSGCLILGTSGGALLVYPLSREASLCSSFSVHPRVLKTRQSRSRQSRSRVSFTNSTPGERDGRRAPNEETAKIPSSSAVEDICHLPHCGLLATVTGEGRIYFWDSCASVLKATFLTNLKPEECILCLQTCDVQHSVASVATKKKRSLLLSSCDWGFVYVRDASSLPLESAPLADFASLSLPLLSIFRAHNEPVTQLAPMPGLNVVVTLSVYDSMIKLFTLSGEYIGYLGQEEDWNIKDPRTFGRNSRALPLDDGLTCPRPTTVNPGRRGSTPYDVSAPYRPGDSSFLTLQPRLDREGGDPFISVNEDQANDESFATRRIVSLSCGGDSPSSPVGKGSGLLKASLSAKKRFTPAEAQVALGGDSRVRRLASLSRIPDPCEPDCQLLLPLTKKEAPRRISTLMPRSQSTGPGLPRALDPIERLSRSHSALGVCDDITPVRMSGISLLHQVVSVERSMLCNKIPMGDLTENIVALNRLARESRQGVVTKDWSSRAAALLPLQDVPQPTGLAPSPAPFKVVHRHKRQL